MFTLRKEKNITKDEYDKFILALRKDYISLTALTAEIQAINKFSIACLKRLGEYKQTTSIDDISFALETAEKMRSDSELFLADIHSVLRKLNNIVSQCNCMVEITDKYNNLLSYGEKVSAQLSKTNQKKSEFDNDKKTVTYILNNCC